MSLYLRDDERRAANPAGNRTRGVAVFAGKRRWFFPGGEPWVGLALAEIEIPAILQRPDVRVEYGTADGPQWISEQVLRG